MPQAAASSGSPDGRHHKRSANLDARSDTSWASVVLVVTAVFFQLYAFSRLAMAASQLLSWSGRTTARFAESAPSRGMRFVRTATLGLAILTTAGASAAPTGTPPLPEINMESLPYIGKQPVHPFIKDQSGGLSRTLFMGPGPANTTMTIQDVLVNPQTTGKIAAFRGPAVVTWMEGKGTFSVGNGSPQEIGSGNLVLPARQDLKITNTSTSPIGARIYVFIPGS